MRAPIDATTLLRAGLLEGVSIVCAGASGARSDFAVEVQSACAGLGARVCTWVPAGEGDGASARAEDVRLDFDVLCVDGAGAFHGAAEGDGGPRAGLDSCLELAWEATRALVAEGLTAQAGADGVAGAHDRGATAAHARAGAMRARRIIYIAPAASGGAHADAARAGLENLARTLSIEWARFAVSTVAIAPGARTSAVEVGALVAYLCSAAAGYFSGCLLDLTGPAVSSSS